MSTKKYKSIDIILQEAKGQLERQLNVQNLTIAKASILAAAFFVIWGDEPKADTALSMSVWLMAFMGMLCAISCVFPQKINLPPNLESLYKKYLHKDSLYTQRALLDRYMVASKEMIKANNKRSKRMALSAIFLIICILLLITPIICSEAKRIIELLTSL